MPPGERADFGAWAPLLNTVLFSLYHFFTPWQNVGRIVGFLPIVYAAWWKKSIYVSMGTHVLGNFSAMLLLLPVPAMDGIVVTAGDVVAQGSIVESLTPSLGLVYAAQTAGRALEAEGGSVGGAAAGQHARLQKR